ncbi:hypothetical protein Saro_1514 [Novosphingobium aromaticivorans DSM 12444]|uniref:Uncharacterized protein n=1 Tax=Novosphingobium aromaticivorans (strain ATCC 700278 / DSM 12444 / CCUG 56034 / CIP 105152 / NBRC 16084 / F199) TaxID=279238 RepID=Q2G868_NOVAD|nr:hypothetical protein Saro_1514 [Novosphingobium aromaticivorans DSM 12444]
MKLIIVTYTFGRRRDLRSDVDGADRRCSRLQLASDGTAESNRTCRNCGTDDRKDQHVLGSRGTRIVADEIVEKLGHDLTPVSKPCPISIGQILDQKTGLRLLYPGGPPPRGGQCGTSATLFCLTTSTLALVICTGSPWD